MLKLGDRMKQYESVTTAQRFKQEDVVIARLDGRSFSSFTRTLKKRGPFHSGFTDTMKAVTQHLVEAYNPVIGYTQSDEITLVFINGSKSEHPFGGRVFKIQSLMAADASVYFGSLLPVNMPEKIGTQPVFDCRCFTVPSKKEAYECIVWRRQDGYRNAVSTVAREYFSDKELHSIRKEEQLSMLMSKGVNFKASIDPVYQHGTCYARIAESHVFTAEELSTLPPKHQAHSNPNLSYLRHIVKEVSFEDVEKFIENVNKS